jgi:hypothetical protein
MRLVPRLRERARPRDRGLSIRISTARNKRTPRKDCFGATPKPTRRGVRCPEYRGRVPIWTVRYRK